MRGMERTYQYDEMSDKGHSGASCGPVSFSSFTSDQWRTWTLVYSTLTLQDILERRIEEYGRILWMWYQLGRNELISVDEVEKGHD